MDPEDVTSAAEGTGPQFSPPEGSHIRYRDHPPAHFHVRYAESKATIAIETMEIIRGTLPARVYGLVAEWGVRHQALLREDWQRAFAGEPLFPIPPLE